MMIAYRFVRLIETHADALATGLLHRVRNSKCAQGYSNVPPEELQHRVYEIYNHLGDWLLGKSEFEIERRYSEIGARRAHQHVPLSQLTWAIILTKENLFEFLKRESIPDSPVEIFGELEMLQLLDQFFDRAVYYASLGYERAVAAQALQASGAGRAS
jgi:hypothetical protein